MMRVLHYLMSKGEILSVASQFGILHFKAAQCSLCPKMCWLLHYVFVGALQIILTLLHSQPQCWKCKKCTHYPPHLEEHSENHHTNIKMLFPICLLLKGTVQQELRGVETRLKRPDVINFHVGNIYFLNETSLVLLSQSPFNLKTNSGGNTTLQYHCLGLISPLFFPLDSNFTPLVHHVHFNWYNFQTVLASW